MKRRPLEHRCPAPNCHSKIPPNVVLCRTHWFALPKAMRFGLLDLDRPSAAYDQHFESMLVQLRGGAA